MSEQANITTRVKGLRDFLAAPAVLKQVKLALPAGLSPERTVRQLLTVIQKNPVLLQCTDLSILAGLIQAAELGLELSSTLGQAYLVPRWNRQIQAREATFQVGYRGLMALAFRSGQVTAMPVRVVYQNDLFSVEYGTVNQLRHAPAPGNRGDAIGYYAVAVMRGGGHDFEHMTKEEALYHRERYSPKGDRLSPWDTNFDEMALKTCARRLCKRLALSPEAQTAALLDEEGEMLLAPPVSQSHGRAAEQLVNGAQAEPADEDEADDRAEREAIQNEPEGAAS